MPESTASPSTVPLPKPEASANPIRPTNRFWRELSGALAVGLAALAAVVVVFQLLAWAREVPGPGVLVVLGHLVAAGLAVLVQRFADHHAGWRCALAVLGVTITTAAALWLFWWA